MSYKKIVHIKVRDQDHYIYVAKHIKTGMLHIFKYNQVCCQFEYFSNIRTAEQLNQAIEWANSKMDS